MSHSCRPTVLAAYLLTFAAFALAVLGADDEPLPYDATAATLKLIGTTQVQPLDWPQWGGSSLRNNTPEGRNIPTDWDIQSGKNIKWRAKLGSQTHGNPVIANGHVYVGTTNGHGYIQRYPVRVGLGVLLCFDEKDGRFLWQDSNVSLPGPNFPLVGVCSAPCVDGQRLWYVNNRGEVCCLDTEGFRDGENDGPYTDEPTKTEAGDPAEMQYEADVIWKLDMIARLQVAPRDVCNCSVMCAGDTLFVGTSNGTGANGADVPQPQAPSFLALDRNTGKVLWRDNSPRFNILRGQWSSPAYGVFDGHPQVLFAGGDGWLYSFDPQGDGEGWPTPFWKFDCNPKESIYLLGNKSTRNNLAGTPVVYDGLMYIAVGENPENGEGPGHLWCIDPTKRGDVSPELVFNKGRPDKPIPHKRLQACEPKKGDFTKPNPSSAAVWHYTSCDINQNKKIGFDERMHRTIGTVAIKNDLLFVADFSGYVHCVNAKTGIPHWTHDLRSASWGSALIVEDHVYFGDEDGDVIIFALSAEKRVVAEISMGNSVYTTPVVANNVLFIANKDELFAIEKKP